MQTPEHIKPRKEEHGNLKESSMNIHALCSLLARTRGLSESFNHNVAIQIRLVGFKPNTDFQMTGEVYKRKDLIPRTPHPDRMENVVLVVVKLSPLMRVRRLSACAEPENSNTVLWTLP